MIIAMTSGGILVDGLPLIELPPTYECSNATSSYKEVYTCTPFNAKNAEKDYPTWCPNDPYTGEPMSENNIY